MILIPAPETTLTGATKEWLQDLKKFGFKQLSLEEARARLGINIDEALEVLEGTVKQFEQCLKVRSDEGLTSSGFWAFMNSLLNTDQANTYNRFKPYVGVYELEVFLEIPVTELTQPVPVGLHNSTDENDAQLTWQNWSAGGDQPIATSLDNTKCVVRTNINAVAVDMDELKILGTYAQGNANIKLLNTVELAQLQQSAAYYSEI